MTISVVFVSPNSSIPLQEHSVTWDEDSDSFSESIRELLQVGDYLETPLLRPTQNTPGLYAYYNVPTPEESTKMNIWENIRATRLAMACGLLSLRFSGNVLLVRSYGGHWENLTADEVWGACCVSPDLRESVQQEVAQQMSLERKSTTIPAWLADASQQNYHDGAALAKVISAMQQEDDVSDSDDGSDSDSDESDKEEGNGASEHPSTPQEQRIHLAPSTTTTTTRNPGRNAMIPSSEFVTHQPLCLHCRRLSSDLCDHCTGAYFCTEPRTCRRDGWSHRCQCDTWKVYSTQRRKELSQTFAHQAMVDPNAWQTQLIQRSFQVSETPYEEFLLSLGIDETCTTWWRTERGGWSGGNSTSACSVDASVRRSFADGFAPIQDIPMEQRVTKEDWERAGLGHRTNEIGLGVLSSWEDYYALRQLPMSSTIALLCTFPLTLYYAIERFGAVPVTVARMLKRPLRIHIVGAEKEMNFLDLFKEVGYLLPQDVVVELAFVVRQDMLPTKIQESTTDTQGSFSMKVELADNLTIGVISGTYGDSLDPNFDVGTGPPDMVIAFNAGLYAYDSWRSVVTYLYHHKGVVGVFSDYNEYSGMNCAALGGAKSRNSLQMNPFRQPRAMPVYSMNLPQFSNGFLYVYNEQELD